MAVQESFKRNHSNQAGMGSSQNNQKHLLKQWFQKLKKYSLTFENEEMEAFWVYDKIMRKKFIFITCYLWKISHLIISSEEQEFFKDYGFS